MLTYCYAVWDEFINFIGGRSGLAHWLLFGLALLCCAAFGKNIRKKLFWPSVLVMIFFFNPVFYAVVGTRFLSGVYWRLLWMLPISFVIAYVLTQMTFKINRNVVRVGAAALSVICIMVTGERIFSDSTYNEKENAYELPQAAIEISDIIMGELSEWKETIIVPYDLLCYIRQYSCSVGLLYGRNAEGFISGIEEEEAKVFSEMNKENPDVGLITEIAKEKKCRYIIFDAYFHQIPEDLTEYGYERYRVVEEKYVMYRRIEE